MSRAVVLLSGGLDSATVLAIAQDEGHDLYPLSFHYGQHHYIELDSACWQAEARAPGRHKVIDLDLRQLGGPVLTDHRNLIMLSFTTAYMELIEADNLFAGMKELDSSGYIAAMNIAVALAMKRAVTVQAPLIRTPLIDMTKAQIIERGLELGVDYAHTHSCCDPQMVKGDARISSYYGYAACGVCDSCVLRIKGFEIAGVPDPAVYLDAVA